MRKRHGREKKPQLWEAACAKAREEKCSESDGLGCEPGREERPHRMVSRGIPGCQAMLGHPHPKQVCRERVPVSFEIRLAVLKQATESQCGE